MSTKVGRNAPCPCGSGKKYKRCCLDRPAAGTSATANPNIFLLPGSVGDRVRSMHEVAHLVKRRCDQRPEWDACEYETGKIQITIDELTSTAREILHANAHSRQYFFILLRKVGPQLWDDFQRATQHEYDADWFGEAMMAASRLIIDCARSGETWEWRETEEGKGIYFGDLQAADLDDLSRILALAQLWYEAKVRFRHASKGLRVFAKADEPDPLQTQDRSAIESYERRRDKYESISGTAGLWFDPTTTTALRPDWCHWMVTRMIKQRGMITVVSRDPPWEIPLTYFPAPLFQERIIRASDSAAKPARNLIQSPDRRTWAIGIPYDRIITELGTAIETSLQVERRELISFLYSVHLMILETLRFDRFSDRNDSVKFEIVWDGEPIALRQVTSSYWYDAGELGLLRSSEDDWIRMLTLKASRIAESDPSVVGLSESRMRELMGRFLWSEERPIKMNDPVLFMRLSRHTTVLDVLGLADFLRHLLLQISLLGRAEGKGGSGDVTGGWLEEKAFQFFVRNLELTPACSWLQKKIGKEAEIDIAFVHRRILFVIDCKAMAKDAEFIAGQYNKLRNRHSEFLKELTEKIPKRIALVAQGKAKPDIDPSDFDRSIGLVCTSAVEYLPRSEKRFWSGEYPLVGPPEELLDSIAGLSR